MAVVEEGVISEAPAAPAFEDAPAVITLKGNVKKDVEDLTGGRTGHTGFRSRL